METIATAKQFASHTNGLIYMVENMRNILLSDEVLDLLIQKYVFFVTYYIFFDEIKCITHIRRIIRYDENFIYLNKGDIIDRINNPKSLFLPKMFTRDNNIESTKLNPKDLVDSDFKLKYNYNL